MNEYFDIFIHLNSATFITLVLFFHYKLSLYFYAYRLSGELQKNLETLLIYGQKQDALQSINIYFKYKDIIKNNNIYIFFILAFINKNVINTISIFLIIWTITFRLGVDSGIVTSSDLVGWHWTIIDRYTVASTYALVFLFFSMVAC